MTGRVQTLRSNVAGNRPTGRQPGELYVNWPDRQLGVVDSTATAVDLLAVRYFSASTNYNPGDYVVQGGKLYTAKGAVPAGAFNATQWSLTGGNVNVGDTAPATPDAGALWFDSAVGQLFVYYNDGNTSQWVIATNAGKTDLSGYLARAGGTMTGPMTLAADPVAPLQPATAQYVDGARYGDNRLINGDMRIDQRNNGASGTAVGGFPVDRWIYSASQAAKGTWQRGGPSPTLPGVNGFSYYLMFTSSSAYTSLAADTFTFIQRIEADAISDFAFGTASAQPVTLSFWASSSLIGTFGGSICNDTGLRSYPFSFSIPVANVWTRVVINIPGDTAGTWTLGGNTAAMVVRFDFGSGSNFRGAAGAWVGSNIVGVTGSVSVVGTNGATFLVTGVKLEIDNVATPFVRQSLTKSLADCQRYFYKPANAIYSGGYGAGAASSNAYLIRIFPVTMRAAPTQSGATFSNANANTPAITHIHVDGVTWNATNTAAGSFQLAINAGTETYSAEL